MADVYNDKIITSAECMDTMKQELATQKDDASTQIEYLTSQLETIDKNIVLVNQNIDNNKQIAEYYKENPAVFALLIISICVSVAFVFLPEYLRVLRKSYPLFL